MTNLTDHEHNELLMFYQLTVDDIEKTKQWGWVVTYTTIAAQGGVLGLFSVYVPLISPACIKLLFAVLILGLAAVARNHINHAQSSLAGFRTRINAIRSNFGEPLQRSFGEPNPKKQWPLEPMLWASTAIFMFLLLAGRTNVAA